MVGSLSIQLGERLAIADYELKVSHARRSNVRVVDFGELTVVECVPDLAGSRVRGPEAVLVCLGPDRPLARGPRSTTLGCRIPRLRPTGRACYDYGSNNSHTQQQAKPEGHTVGHQLSLSSIICTTDLPGGLGGLSPLPAQVTYPHAVIVMVASISRKQHTKQEW